LRYRNILRTHSKECRYRETVHGGSVPKVSDAKKEVLRFITETLFA
jgi:hypothetical protein